MQFIWSRKFISANILILTVIKLALVYPVIGLFALISGNLLFSGDEIVDATNSFRQELGITPLAVDVNLTKAAEAKLNDMLENQYFAHVSPAGIDPWHWLTQNGYHYSYAGENLAIGFFDATGTVNAWEDSPSHRKNMADSRYTQIGVAVANSKIKDFGGMVVVQLFGTPPQTAKSQLIAKASPAPIPEASPSVKITPSPTPAIAVITPQPSPSATFTPTPKSEPLTITYVGPSDIESAPDKILSEAITAIPKQSRSMSVMNRIFIIYAAIIALASVFLLFTASISERQWLKVFLHLAILAAALFYYPDGLNGIALIF